MSDGTMLTSWLVERTATTLVHSIWIFAFIAWIAAVLLKWVPTPKSGLRHNIALGSLLALPVSSCFIFLFAPSVPSPLAGAGRIYIEKTLLDESDLSTTLELQENSEVVNLDQMVTSAPIASDSPESQHKVANTASKSDAEILPRIGLPNWFGAATAFIWLIGFLFLTIKRITSFARLFAFRKQCLPVTNPKMLNRVQILSKRLRLNMPVDVMQSSQILAPVVFGWLRPTLVFPISFVSGLSSLQIDAIISHELAHIKRHDFVWKMIQLSVEAVFYYHPATWWISRRLQTERENCCDDRAVASGIRPIELAQAIAAIEHRRLELALAFGDGNTSAMRVHRLLRKHASNRPSTLWGAIMFTSLQVTALSLFSVICFSNTPQAKAVTEMPNGKAHPNAEETLDSARHILFVGEPASWSARYLKSHASQNGFGFDSLVLGKTESTKADIDAAKKKILKASCLVLASNKAWDTALGSIEKLIYRRVQEGELDLIILGKREGLAFTIDSPLCELAPIRNLQHASAERFSVEGQIEVHDVSAAFSLYSISNCALKTKASTVVGFKFGEKVIPVVARLQKEQSKTTYVGHTSGLYRLRSVGIRAQYFLRVGKAIIDTPTDGKRILFVGSGATWDMRLFNNQWSRSGHEINQLDPEKSMEDEEFRDEILKQLESTQVLVFCPLGIKEKVPQEIAEAIKSKVQSGDLHLVVFQQRNRLLSDYLPDSIVSLLPIEPGSVRPVDFTKQAVIRADDLEFNMMMTRHFRSLQPKETSKVRAKIVIDEKEYPFIVESTVPKGRSIFVATNELWRTRKNGAQSYSQLWRVLLGESADKKTQAVEQVSQEAKNEIENSSFQDWKNGLPVGWKFSIGAKNGADQPVSAISKGDSALVLAGSRATRAWQFVQQPVELSPGETYLLSWEAKAQGLRREGNQFDNCYVGMFFNDRSGQVLGNKIANIPESDWQERKLVFRVPRGTATGSVSIFLSKTGQLSVRKFKLIKYSEKDSFQILVDEMDRNYSFFELKKIDWKALTEKYRARAEQAETPRAFGNVVAEMLAELKDVHTWTRLPGGKKIAKFRSGHRANYDFRVVKKQLNDIKEIKNGGMLGRTKEGYGYVAVTALVDASAIEQIVTATQEMFDAPGIIVDLRSNIGGGEGLAKQIAELFNDEKRVYAKSKFRAGPKHDAFTQAFDRSFGPRDGKTFTKPVVCLIGPGCVSSGEGFAMMMKSLPNVSLIGQPTRGASGNPGIINLPNGVDVAYSRWISLMPDGTPIEEVGVKPDIEIEHQRGADDTFQQAIRLLGEKIENRK